MALYSFNYTSKIYLPIAIGCCPTVILCLDPVWRDRTVSGRNIIEATIQNAGRQLINDPDEYKPRCNDVFQYQIAVDSALFIVNPGTGLPWELTCSDIFEVSPYDCTTQSLLHIIDTRPDWALDCEGVVTTIDAPDKIFTVYFPVIDRVSGDPVCDFTLDFSALYDDTDTWSTLSEYNTDVPGGHMHTTPDGDETEIHILSQTAGNNASYNDGIFVGTDSLDDYGEHVPGGYQHTALDGTAKPIVILSQDAGNILTAGSDDGNYLAISADANNDIELGSDDGIFSCAYNNGQTSDGVATVATTAIDGVGVYIIGTSDVMTIVNGNPCRARAILFCNDNTFQATLLATGVWKARVQESVDSGAWTTIAEAQYGPNDGKIVMPLVLPTFDARTIPVSTTQTYQWRLVIETLVPSAVGSEITNWSIGTRVLYVGE